MYALIENSGEAHI